LALIALEDREGLERVAGFDARAADPVVTLEGSE